MVRFGLTNPQMLTEPVQGLKVSYKTFAAEALRGRALSSFLALHWRRS